MIPRGMDLEPGPHNLLPLTPLARFDLAVSLAWGVFVNEHQVKSVRCLLCAA